MPASDLTREVAELRRIVETMAGESRMKTYLRDQSRIAEIRADAEARAGWLVIPPKDRVAALRAMTPIVRDRLLAVVKLAAWVETIRGRSAADRRWLLSCVPTSTLRDRIVVELVPADQLPQVLRLSLNAAAAAKRGISKFTVPAVQWRDADHREHLDEPMTFLPDADGWLIQAGELAARVQRDDYLRDSMNDGLIATEALDERAVRAYVLERGLQPGEGA